MIWLILFTNHTIIYGHDANIVNLYVSMTQELVKLTDRFRGNLPSINLAKTHYPQYILFTNSLINKTNLQDIIIRDEHAKTSTHVKFLELGTEYQLNQTRYKEIISKRLSGYLVPFM